MIFRIENLDLVLACATEIASKRLNTSITFFWKHPSTHNLEISMQKIPMIFKTTIQIVTRLRCKDSSYGIQNLYQIFFGNVRGRITLKYYG